MKIGLNQFEVTNIYLGPISIFGRLVSNRKVRYRPKPQANKLPDINTEISPYPSKPADPSTARRNRAIRRRNNEEGKTECDNCDKNPVTKRILQSFTLNSHSDDADEESSNENEDHQHLNTTDLMKED